jgi:pilus assembly protein CpaC
MTRFYPRLLVLVAALASAVLLAAAPVSAAPKVVAPAGDPLVVEVGKGHLVRLEHPATSVVIANPAIADVHVMSPSLVYVFGKSGGDTSLLAVGDDERVVVNLPVRVQYNIERVEEAIHEAAPRSAVSVNSYDGSLILNGTVFSAAESDDIRRVAERFVKDPKSLVNNMKVDAPNQINLRVRVAEVSRSVVKQLGVNWENLFTPGNFLFGVATGNPVLAGPGQFLTRQAAASGDATNSVFGSFSKGSADLNVLIDALDKQGLVTILAEPNLTAVSGEPASFLAGGQFPVPVPQGLGQVSLDFKNFGVSLSFVATIGANNRINMHVQPEVSELSTAGAITIDSISVPALTVRRADTTLDIASGQSFAIAGLLQNNVTQSISKFPWLGDVPVLGTLFRSESFQRNESELVIIVTPYIVRPVATAARLQAPTDGYVPSSDNDLLWRGSEFKPQVVKHGAAPVSRSGGSLVGPVGFDLD